MARMFRSHLLHFKEVFNDLVDDFLNVTNILIQTTTNTFMNKKKYFYKQKKRLTSVAILFKSLSSSTESGREKVICLPDAFKFSAEEAPLLEASFLLNISAETPPD